MAVGGHHAAGAVEIGGHGGLHLLVGLRRHQRRQLLAQLGLLLLQHLDVLGHDVVLAAQHLELALQPDGGVAVAVQL